MKISLAVLAVVSSLVACTLGDPNDWVNIEYVLAHAASRFGGSSSTADAQAYIVREAEVWARKGPWSVVDEQIGLPPSGDAHDFLSWAPYHWPDCDWCRASGRSYEAILSGLNLSQSSELVDPAPIQQSWLNLGHEGTQSIFAVPAPTRDAVEPTVAQSSVLNTGLSSHAIIIDVPSTLHSPSPSINLLTSTSTISTSTRRAPGPAQAAAKTTKASCTPSPTKTLQPSATWTTCPYISRDGVVNPDVRTLKGPDAINSAAQAVIYNAIAFALQKSPSPSKSAIDIIDAFFLASNTKMNPNVQFGQVVRGPGPSGRTGTFTGVLDLRGLVKVVNGIAMLKANGSPDWDAIRDKAMLSWAAEYTQWLTSSDIGKKTASRANNHGTFYASQLAALKYLLGDRKGAIEVLQNFCKTTFLDQIAKSGEQPFEAARTRPWHYRCFNLEALITNAKLADELGINLWDCKSKYGATIQTAVDFLMSTNPGDEDASLVIPHVAAVAAAYGDPQGKYMSFLKKNEPSYVSKAFWFYNQAAAFPNAPSSRSQATAMLWRKEHSLTIRDSTRLDPPAAVEVKFECPQVFKDEVQVEIEDDLFVTCEELQGFYTYVPDA